MQFDLKKVCDDHPNQEVNYVYQQDLDSLKLGCFSCATSEDGSFFYNLKHFMHQVEDLVQQRLELYKKGNHLYFEINSLIQDFKKIREGNRQYFIIEEIASFFEINENNYKLQFSTQDKYSIHSCSNQAFSEQSENEDSHYISQHSLNRDFEDEVEISDNESDFKAKNFIEFSYKQAIRKLKNQAISEALDKCQDIKSHNYLPEMSWKQFKQYSQYYVNLEYKYFYHIYSESNNNNNNNNDQDTFEEYESRYSATRTDSLSKIQSKTGFGSSSSPERNQQLTSQLSLSSNRNESSRKNSLSLQLDTQNMDQEDGSYFHECIECSIIFQQTQDQIDLIEIMFQDIKQIILYQKFISTQMTFDPIQIFWDLRIDF